MVLETARARAASLKLTTARRATKKMAQIHFAVLRADENPFIICVQANNESTSIHKT
jgi:hypothetical protein